jgi:hypothetical protein
LVPEEKTKMGKIKYERKLITIRNEENEMTKKQKLQRLILYYIIYDMSSHFYNNNYNNNNNETKNKNLRKFQNIKRNIFGVKNIL